MIITETSRYSPENVEPRQFADPERHQTAMREVAEPVLFAADDGQRFSGLHLNRDFSSNPIHVRLNSMFGDSSRADQQYIAYSLAAAFPDKQIVIVDQPSHGSSDNLTEAQAREIKTSGSLTLVGQAHVQALRNQIPNAGLISASGEALGARMAIEFAAEAPTRDFESDHLFGFDTVGLETRFSPFLGFGYLGNVLRSRSRYGKTDAHKMLKSAFEEEFIPELEKYGPAQTTTVRHEAGVWKRDKSLFTFLFRNSPLANDHGLESLVKALEQNDLMEAHLVFGGLSAVGRYNNRVSKKLEVLDRHFDHRIDAQIWPNDDQGIGYAHQHPRLIRFMQDAVS